MKIGDKATLNRIITYEDILKFAQLTGDSNPLHTDTKYAESNFFGSCVAQGMLVSSIISSVIGTKLPGPGSIYLGHDLKFMSPVRPGELINVCVEIIDLDPLKGHIILNTEVTNKSGDVVTCGEARIVMSSFLMGKLNQKLGSQGL